MNLLQLFINFLLNQRPKPSLLTVKNYKADISQFIAWFEKEFSIPFNPSTVTMQILQKYKNARNLSESSIERHTSSLRKFFNFLKAQKIIIFDLFPAANCKEKAEADPWMIRNFKNFLYENKKSNPTIKNYINDIKGFFIWFSEVALIKCVWNVADKNLPSRINNSVVEEYKQRLISAKFSPRTVNRKLSSLRNYIGWAKSQGLIPQCHPEFISGSPAFEAVSPQAESAQHDKETDYSSFPPARLTEKSLKGASLIFDMLFIFPIVKTLQQAQYLIWKVTGKKIFRRTLIAKSLQKAQPEEITGIRRDFYAPLSISTRYLPLPKKIWHYLRYARPNWYKRYHSYSFTHYLHFAILTALSCAIGFGIYGNFFTDTHKDNDVLGSSTSAPPRVLSFQGKLTDSTETPITKETTILFSLYDNETASTGASLWQESNAVKPDSDGIFSVFLGKQTPIPDTTFSQNSQLFLGITVGDSPELRPRQEIATVPFAGNTRTLQGLEPITNSTNTSNVVLALNSSGNLSIAGSKAHTFQTIGGQFVLSGKILSLTTLPGSNSNIEIVPDGLGKIDLSRPIQNSTNNSNLAAAAGSVEFDDTVAILATTSAQAALYINQNSTGAIISASTSGTAKFVVENDGTGKFTGDLMVNGGDMTSTATTFNLFGSTVTTLNVGNSSGSTYIKSGLSLDKDLTLKLLTSNGGILYTNGSGKILQVSAGSSSDCLKGGTTPSFSACSTDNIFSQTNGAIYPGNTTLALLIGGNSTSSALIKLPGTNVAGSNDSWFNAGNVGIGTTAPLLRLDIRDSQSATAAAQIFNTDSGTDADGLIIKLGNSTGTVSSTNHFLSFETAGIGIVGSVQGNGGDGVTYATSGVADFAEYLKKDRNQNIPFGSVVCLQENGLAVACSENSNQVIGVASERPAFLGGENLGNSSIAVGLIGQIETFVTNLNGEIKAGDPLAASDASGVAVKATRIGQIIGKALEDLDAGDESKVIGYYDPDSKEYRSKADLPDVPLKPTIVKVFKIPALINISWYDPGSYLSQNGDLALSNGSNGHSISNSKNETLDNIGGFFQIIAANIKTGLINASEVVANTLVVTSDSIIVNGQSLRDYIVSVVKNSGIAESGLTSPIVNTDQLSANIISPLSSPSLIVKLATPSGSFTVENASGSAVARIDDQGNARFAGDIEARRASFSGQLSASGGQFKDASISGILRATSIIADSIEGLDTKVSSIAAEAMLNAKYLTLDSYYADIASYSAQLANIPDLIADRAQLNQGLMVFGSTSLSDLSVAGRLSIGGTMFITENSMETLGTNLSLQSLRQGGLSIMGGLVYIDTEGNVKIQGDLSVTGKMVTNIISPLPTSDLVINNARGSSVLSINQAGDIVASGSGTFAKLNFNLIEPVLAVSSTEVIASSSAGVADIAPYQSEITIRNPLVTNKSVIYITPVGTPSAQTPFLMRQTRQEQDGGSFTVGVQSPTNHPINFNWLIVN